MKTELKIIKLFMEDKKPKTIREVAKQINADYKITHTATQRLVKQKVINAQPVGQSLLCQLNVSYYGTEIYQAESERREEMLKNKNIQQLYQEITTKVNSGFFILLVFGSYAKNKQIKGSDIDLLFISNENDFENCTSDILSLLPLKTHHLVFTEKEFIRMKDAKSSNVIQEAIENNIILYGIETYYQLKNAR